MENQNAIILNAIAQLHEEVKELRAEIKNPKQKLLTFQEKCNEMKKTRSTLWRYVRDGKITPIYVADKPYFKPNEIL